MENNIQMDSRANLVVLHNDAVSVFDLSGKLRWSFGRPTSDFAPDISIASRIVSKEHGEFTYFNGQWFYTDIPSNSNGTFYNGVKIEQKGAAIPLKQWDILRVDSPNLQAGIDERGVLVLFLEEPVDGMWSTYRLSGGKCVIGRDRNRCQIVLNKSFVSAVHTEISFSGNTYSIRDLATLSGTYIHNKNADRPVPLRERDIFHIGDKIFIFSHGALIFNRDEDEEMVRQRPVRKAPVILHADIKTKKVKSNEGPGMKELIRDVHLDIRQGSLVALLGTAGAGKSTVMNCLNGMDLGGVQGRVMFKNVNLMTDFNQMSFLIGSVPQKKVFHPTFTPEEEFRFAALMRLPGDTSKREIEARVDHTIKILGMQNVRRNQNCKLSGGEQSRVNVGIELVADRELLCLDEPDAGLSPNLKHELFMILRELAHKNHKSILTIIHDVSEIDLFDQVIIMVKADNVGRLAFSGTPEECRNYFGCDVRDVYAKLEADPKKYIQERRSRG